MSCYSKLVATAVCTLTILTASAASAVVKHDESVNGDISGNRLSPTQITLQAGINSVLATTGSNPTLDQEYLRVDLPAGHRLDQILMASYTALMFDDTAFIGVQTGTTFTFDPNNAFANIPNLLGYAHFGPNEGDNPGDDIMPKIGAGGGAAGFAGSLSGPSYTFWLQQTGGNSEYQLDFVVSAVPEPASIGMMLAAGGVMVAGGRRVRRRGAI